MREKGGHKKPPKKRGKEKNKRMVGGLSGNNRAQFGKNQEKKRLDGNARGLLQGHLLADKRGKRKKKRPNRATSRTARCEEHQSIPGSMRGGLKEKKK